MPLTIQTATFKYKNSNGNFQTADCIKGESIIEETVSGITPAIMAVDNHRYTCGEVSTLSFTPCATGICDVIFTSGNTATVLTVPNTIKWPDWFDPTSLNVNTTYEINVLNGIYGTVGVWT